MCYSGTRCSHKPPEGDGCLLTRYHPTYTCSTNTTKKPYLQSRQFLAGRLPCGFRALSLMLDHPRPFLRGPDSGIAVRFRCLHSLLVHAPGVLQRCRSVPRRPCHSRNRLVRPLPGETHLGLGCLEKRRRLLGLCGRARRRSSGRFDLSILCGIGIGSRGCGTGDRRGGASLS